MKRHNDQPIHEVLRNLVKKGPLEQGFYDTKVKEIWKEKIGKLIMKHTSKIFYKNGTVYINLSSAPLRNELMMGKEKLIESFNEELGSNIIKAIVLR